MNLLRFFFTAALFIASLLSAADDFFTGPFTQMATLGNDVLLVKDACNKQFILKYPTKFSPNVTELSIHETMGAKIGLAAHININEVKLFPAYDTSLQSIDIKPGMPKTLHTLVPGTEVANSTIAYQIDIFGALSNKKNLESLTHHKKLCQIVALDLFTSNWDRHNGNLFFDDKTNQFYAIDMDLIFSQLHYISPSDNNTNYPNILFKIYCFLSLVDSVYYEPYHSVLSSKAYDFLKNIDPKQLSQKEIEALKEINATLETLQTIYPPKKLYDEWINIAKEAHYSYHPQKQQYIRYLIAYNHREITKIRAQINYLLSDGSCTSYLQTLKDYTTIAWQTGSLNVHFAKIAVA